MVEVPYRLEERARRLAALGQPHRLALVEALASTDLAPTEAARLLDIDSNLLAHHVATLEAANIVRRSPSAGDGRRRYLRLVPGAVDGLVRPTMPTASSVLFVCTGNSARSQFAQALWERTVGGDAQSAGLQPAPRVHPTAVEVAAAHGIDLRDRAPKGYRDVTGHPDLVVSVCDRAKEASTPFRARTLHWSIPDPVEGGRRRDFEAAFEEIERRIRQLATHDTRETR